MSKKYDIVYAQPTKEGEKPRWINCGAVFETQKGPRIKLDSIPVGFNGWFALFEPRQQQEKPAQKLAPDFDDDINF